ncbi:hypothetical protein VA596_33015 [Amycolatopsis sp., V23-08]|uniref:Uncharacterized protein n=1 Tax=Amycolatopsis heterodermiae TaxID=3110235 RepID=A0ABU5RDP4_9PSEU|nr:hypothetical protein [Amycolatopsis sp., V23-08]MEA5364392.1 hypothetical protein [Amycolatopsis sp., V23-08]
MDHVREGAGASVPRDRLLEEPDGLVVAVQQRGQAGRPAARTVDAERARAARGERGFAVEPLGQPLRRFEVAELLQQRHQVDADAGRLAEEIGVPQQGAQRVVAGLGLVALAEDEGHSGGAPGSSTQRPQTASASTTVSTSRVLPIPAGPPTSTSAATLDLGALDTKNPRRDTDLRKPQPGSGDAKAGR